MKQNVLNTIEQLYHYGDFGYVLLNYVDTNVWANKITHQIKGINVENLTDFNYSKCFTLYIIPSIHPKIKIGTDKFREYIREHTYLNGLLVYISAIAPFAAIKYTRYEYVDGEIEMQEQYQPFDEETERIGKDILKLLENEGIQILEKSLLEIEVPNISLELREEEVTVFHCLFEDSY
ncbi:hypothetical protein [Parageobacillus thermoglucosidasius]|jgi:hypothetical protein|uniref:Uncharacterized protein n=1 Tax=Parageobacillus thermoglucosidasius TaxID=1426 RepID=A0A1B7KR61_PARTM|nr:hypothetical protein [Parageobacillus thermoglucosidasius]OAT72583.1 hypothetical protein A7K69_19585 [Parageobacillus thermoglucosidasius]